MMHSNLPCEMCGTTPTNRYIVDQLPSGHFIYLWVCAKHDKPEFMEEEDVVSSSDKGELMTTPDLEAAPLDYQVVTQDERVLVKTASGWMFVGDPSPEYGTAADVEPLLVRPTDPPTAGS